MSLQITGTTSFAELLQAVRATGGYDEAGDADMAWSFVKAGRAILRFGLEESEINGERIRINLAHLKDQVAQAEAWLATQGAPGAGRLPAYQAAPNWRDE